MITPNAIITRDFDTMQRLFFGPSNTGPKKLSFSERLEKIKESENTLICAPGTNNSLLELDFNIPQSSQAQSYINAKFVETNEIIEYFAVGASPLETQFNTIYSMFSKAGVSLSESLGRLNKFYIAFGTGDDMSQWAGPFAVTLGTANIVLDNNVKVVTLGFVCADGLNSVRSYTQKLYGNLGFSDERLNTALSKDTKVRFKFVQDLNFGLNNTKGPRRDPSRKANTKRVFQQPFTWNPFIRKLIKGYLGKVYGGFSQDLGNRVMVLLSEDFDEIINKDLEKADSKDFLRNYESKLKKMGINLKARSPSAPAKASSRNSFTLSEREIDFISKQENRLDLESGERESTLKKYFTEFHEHQGDSQAIKEKKSKYMELIKEDFLLEKGIMDMQSSIDSDPDEGKQDRVLDPIFKFIGALKGHTGSAKEYCLFELADSEILSLLDGAVMRGGGLRPPGGGPGTPRIIFGDVRIIKNLIYLEDDGRSDLNSAYGKLFTETQLDSMDWEGYREEFKNTILARERIQNSSFKEQIDFGPFTNSFKEIKNIKDIIFLHGVKNSNVLSISFQKDIVQGPLLNFNISARQRGPFTNSFIKKAIKNDDFKINDLVEYFKDKGVLGEDSTLDSAKLQNFLLSLTQEEQASLSSIETKTGTDFLAKGRTGTAEDLDNYVSLIVGYNQLQQQYAADLPTAEVPYLSDNSTDNPRSLQTMADLKERMSDLVVNLNIKTLPFFNQKFYFKKNCYLFSIYNNVITTTNDPKENPPSTFLNGQYLIKGARHFMSAKEAFSEFELVKTKPEKDPLAVQTEKSVKEAAPPRESKQQESAPTTISGPITPNPGGKRFPNRPATEETRDDNKEKRKVIAQKRRAENQKQNPRPGINITFDSQGLILIGVPPALTQERQDQVEARLKKVRDDSKIRYEKALRKRPRASALERRALRRSYLVRKKNYDGFMRTKKKNNGVIPTYNVDKPPLR